MRWPGADLASGNVKGVAGQMASSFEFMNIRWMLLMGGWLGYLKTNFNDLRCQQ